MDAGLDVVAELLLRFFLGGGIVSAFAIVGEAFEPKTFAGIFGAAPSVALAAILLSFVHHDAHYVASEGRSMVAGAVALFVYTAACVASTRRQSVPVWLGAVASWLAWLAVALALWAAGTATGVLR